MLTSTGTRYLLIGGHALAVHAEPRFTEDLDVFVQPSLANARRLREALVEFGFGSVMPEPAELAKPGLVWMLGQDTYVHVVDPELIRDGDSIET